jgi:hypothetical protein
MGMLPPRMCSKCHQTSVPGSRFCALHNRLPESRHPRGPLEKLYNCVKWRKWTRQAVLFRDPLCANIINGTRCPRLATDVHHVVDAEEWMARGEDFYDQDNLVGLCHTCHTAIRRGPGTFATPPDNVFSPVI